MSIPEDMIPGEGIYAYIKRTQKVQNVERKKFTKEDLKNFFASIDKTQQDFYEKQQKELARILTWNKDALR